MMKRVLVALLLALCAYQPAEAAVAHFGTDLAWTRDSADTTLTVAMTVTGGHSNTYLHCWVGLVGVGATVSSVTFNGDNLSSQVAVLDFGAASIDHLHGWGLVTPDETTGNIVVTTNIVTDIMVSCATFDGVNQTTPIANRTSDTTDGDGNLTVTAASGDGTTTAIATSNTVVGTNRTLVSIGSFIVDIGYDYALLGTIEHDWDATGMTIGVLGAAIQQFSAGGGPPPGNLLRMGIGK